MQPAAFERFTVDHANVSVSICRACRRFVGAAPDPARLALAEDQHDCLRVPKKPAARTLPKSRAILATSRA